jgi:hypothetical protein
MTGNDSLRLCLSAEMAMTEFIECLHTLPEKKQKEKAQGKVTTEWMDEEASREHTNIESNSTAGSACLTVVIDVATRSEASRLARCQKTNNNRPPLVLLLLLLSRAFRQGRQEKVFLAP